MTTPVIIDAFVVVVLVAFVIYGARRGLLRSLAGVVILIVALVGAGMVAATFSAPVSGIVSPLVEKTVAQKVEEVISDELSMAGQDISSDIAQGKEEVWQLVESFGLREEAMDMIKNRLQEDSAGSAVTDIVLGAVVESLVYSMVYGILYIVAFVLLLLLLHVLLGAMGLVMKLPGLHTLNALGGGLLGLVEGAIVLFLAVWVARKLGISFETELLAEAHILRIFTTYTPLRILSFLQ